MQTVCRNFCKGLFVVFLAGNQSPNRRVEEVFIRISRWVWFVLVLAKTVGGMAVRAFCVKGVGEGCSRLVRGTAVPQTVAHSVVGTGVWQV